MLACAVFIHCPRAVIAANVRDAFRVIQSGGLRLSVLAVTDDPEGIVGSQDAVARASDAAKGDMQQVIDNLTPEERRLAFDTYYMGDRFRYAELGPFLEEQGGADGPGVSVELYRGDPGAIYAAVTKPG